jgi:hypothetical protein
MTTGLEREPQEPERDVLEAADPEESLIIVKRREREERLIQAIQRRLIFLHSPAGWKETNRVIRKAEENIARTLDRFDRMDRGRRPLLSQSKQNSRIPD